MTGVQTCALPISTPVSPAFAKDQPLSASYAIVTQSLLRWETETPRSAKARMRYLLGGQWPTAVVEIRERMGHGRIEETRRALEFCRP